MNHVVVQGLVRGFQQERGLTELDFDEAFETFAGFCVLSSCVDGSFDADSFRCGGGNDLGIDMYGVIVNDELLRDASEVRTAVESAAKARVRFAVIQAKTSPRFETKVVSDLADNLRHVFDDRPLPYPASSDVENLRACRAAVYQDVAKIAPDAPVLDVWYVTTAGQVADMVLAKARAAEKSLTALGIFDRVEFHCVPFRDLRELYRRASEAVKADISMPKRIAMPEVPGVQQAHSGFVPADELVRRLLIGNSGGIRKSLFYENVRDFQGYNEVNSQILETLKDPERSRRFAVLHNGITIVARRMAVVGDKVHIEDFQIVNGCQTCYVLYDARELLTPEVQVPVRLVATRDEAVIGEIVASTNRQTAISMTDLTARDDFQRQLEDYFVAFEPPRQLYYERRSKQYAADQRVEKTRIVSAAQLSRAYLAMFLQDPVASTRSAHAAEERRDELFQPTHLPHAYYTAAATLYRLEWLIRNRLGPGYKPFRYHLLSALMVSVLGTDVLSGSPKALKAQCDKVLNVVWDRDESERAMDAIRIVLDRVIEEAKADGVRPGDLARTRHFADTLRRELGVGQRAARRGGEP